MTQRNDRSDGNATAGNSHAARHWQTEVVHPSIDIPPGFSAYPVPIERASTVVFPDLAAMRERDWRDARQWRYGLHDTPTSMSLSQQLAALEGGRETLLLPSGLAAISVVYFGLLKTGDDVLVPDNVYGPNRDHGDWLARDFGLSVRYYDPMIGAGIADLIRPETRLIWIEAPGSVTMEVPDVGAITRAAKARGAITAIDNTWSAGMTFRPFDHGCDISVQALTKYQSGGSDVLMGAVTVCDDALHKRIRQARMRMGYGVSAEECALVLRSLPSMKLRYEAHDRSAMTVAQWLAGREEVACVLHPAFADCPGHDNWRRDFTGAGGLFSIVLDERYTPAQVDAFVEGLALFDIGFSWGGAHSLAVPYAVPSMRTAMRWPHRGGLVRLYIGLEDVRDLIADLEHSMRSHLT